MDGSAFQPSAGAATTPKGLTAAGRARSTVMQCRMLISVPWHSARCTRRLELLRGSRMDRIFVTRRWCGGTGRRKFPRHCQMSEHAARSSQRSAALIGRTHRVRPARYSALRQEYAVLRWHPASLIMHVRRFPAGWIIRDVSGGCGRWKLGRSAAEVRRWKMKPCLRNAKVGRCRRRLVFRRAAPADRHQAGTDFRMPSRC